MQKWECLRIAISFSFNENVSETVPINYLSINGKAILDRKTTRSGAYNYLNQLGKDGWELVSANYTRDRDKLELYYFKRPVE